MSNELSRSWDSSRTNSREILEVVVHKKGGGEGGDRRRSSVSFPQQPHHPHQRQEQLQPQAQHSSPSSSHPLRQLHQHRSLDRASRLSAMLVRSAQFQQLNHLAEISTGPSTCSRKSNSRDSLDTDSHVTDIGDTHDQAQACPKTAATSGGSGSGNVGVFLNSLGVLSISSLVLGAMSLLLLATVAHHRTTDDDVISDGGYREVFLGQAGNVERASRGVGGSRVYTDGGQGGQGRNAGAVQQQKESSSYAIIGTTEDASSFAANKEVVSSSSDSFRLSGSSADRDSFEEFLAFRDKGQDGVTFTSRTRNGSRLWERPSLLEAAVALATLVLVADLFCLMVCCMQCFFAAKLLTMHRGEERSAKYLKECSSSRLVAVTGFFLSIPAFFVALVMAVTVKLHPDPALTSCALLGVGGLFCVFTVMQNLYHWRVEKTRADDRLPVHERRTLGSLRQRVPASNLAPCQHPPPAAQPRPHPSPTREVAPVPPQPEEEEVESSSKIELSTLV